MHVTGDHLRDHFHQPRCAQVTAHLSEFIGALFVYRSEEEVLGIDAAETAQWRRQHQVPDSDAFDQMFPLSNTPVPVSKKRVRTNTSSTKSDTSESDHHEAKKKPTVCASPA
jgi:hypothetical protein